MTTTEHQTAECSVSDCPCHGWSRQDPPLAQLPLEHAQLTSLTATNIKAIENAFKIDWEQATSTMQGDWETAFYWWLKGRQTGVTEVTKADVEAMGRMVAGRMER
jgi:hypothetical protein